MKIDTFDGTGWLTFIAHEVTDATLDAVLVSPLPAFGDVDLRTDDESVGNEDDDLATVFFEQDGTEVGHQVLDVDRLPEAARHANAVLSATVVDDEVTEWAYEPKETETRQSRAQDRFDRLSKRPPDDDS